MGMYIGVDADRPETVKLLSRDPMETEKHRRNTENVRDNEIDAEMMKLVYRKRGFNVSRRTRFCVFNIFPFAFRFSIVSFRFVVTRCHSRGEYFVEGIFN